ncbi:MAG: hypothetical protein J0M21_10095, partial [Xanthomonadales bacterium]|nr:hypothetical protein [Xanthomonadales bacterium]
MPDTGRFEPRMPGPPDAPADWHDAFAALPAETPTPGSTYKAAPPTRADRYIRRRNCPLLSAV